MADSTNTFEQALAHLRGGRARQAEVICRELLLNDPWNAPALHLLGLLAQQAGRPDQAVAYINNALTVDPKQAVFYNTRGEAYRALNKPIQAREDFARATTLDPKLAAAHFNLALAYEAAGKTREAVAAFRQVLWLLPDHAETHNQLGLLLQKLGERDEAARHFHQAITIRPDFAEAHNNLGNLRLERGEVSLAIESFQRAHGLLPGSPPVLYNLANALRAGGHFQRAVEHYQRALALAPDFAAAHNNLGTLLEELGDLAGGQAALEQAVQLQPQYIEAQLNLATLLVQRRDFDAGIECYRRVVELAPEHAVAHFNLGRALQTRRRWDEAIESYQAALRARPAYAGPHCNLGSLCQARGQDDEALAHFERALEIDPANAEAHCNRAFLKLGQGAFDEGWPELKWHTHSASFGTREFRVPEWNGRPLHERTILLHGQQGLGDTLQWVRYVPWVRQHGGQVLLAVQKSLGPLLTNSGLGTLVDLDDPNLQCDVQASLLSLPILAHGAGEPPLAKVPYLWSTDALIEQWRRALADVREFRVGINWQGNPEYDWDHLRSIPLDAFEPLARLPGVQLVCVQQGHGREQLPAARARFEILNLGDQIDRQSGAFLETAAILQNLDLVITPDSAIAHLAGALGVPVWLALAYAPEWRWRRQGETTPWYPTMRIFRQANFNDWGELFARISMELARLAADKAGATTT